MWHSRGLFEASDLNERAIKLGNAGRYSEAEPLYKRSLAIRESALVLIIPMLPNAERSGGALPWRSRHADAEPLYKRSLRYGKNPSVPIILRSRSR